MKKRMLCAAALAVALGAGCSVDRNAAGVYVSEPVVELGTFTQVGKEGRAWRFEPRSPDVWWRYGRDVPMYVTPGTSIYENGQEVALTELREGRLVRLVYERRRDGSGRAERIDIIAPETGAPPEADL